MKFYKKKKKEKKEKGKFSSIYGKFKGCIVSVSYRFAGIFKGISV